MSMRRRRRRGEVHRLWSGDWGVIFSNGRIYQVLFAMPLPFIFGEIAEALWTSSSHGREEWQQATDYCAASSYARQAFLSGCLIKTF